MTDLVKLQIDKNLLEYPTNDKNSIFPLISYVNEVIH